MLGQINTAQQFPDEGGFRFNTGLAKVAGEVVN
jgi:hypothetical protein